MGFVLGLVWFVIGYVVSQTAVMVWASLMLPGPVGRARTRLERRPWASFFLGAALWGITFGFITVVLQAKGPAQLIGWMMVAPFLASAAIGGGAVARIAAERLRPLTKSDSEAVSLVGGAFCTVLAGLVPLVGWALVFPIISCSSMGAGVVALFTGRKKAVDAPRPVEVAAPPVADFVWQGSAGQSGTPSGGAA
jgi:hypothetical protein